MNIARGVHLDAVKTYGLGLVLCVALSIGAYFFGIKPATGRSQRQQEQQFDLRERRGKSAELSASLAAMHRQIDTTKESLEKLPLRLEPASQINQRLARITDLANACKLTITEIRPGLVTDAVEFQTVPIQIIGTGTYPACAAFLHKLHANFPDTAVRSLETANNNPSPASTAGVYRLELLWHTAPAGMSAQK